MKNKHRYCTTCLLATLFLIPSLKAQQSTADNKSTSSVASDTTSIAPGDNVIFAMTEVKATVDKNLWRRHLETRLSQPTINAMKDGMQPGKYTVRVQFIVEKDGSISNVKALNDPGYGLAEGAVKVVQTGPRWTAAEQNSRKVRSYYTQPITFFIQPTRTVQM